MRRADIQGMVISDDWRRYLGNTRTCEAAVEHRNIGRAAAGGAHIPGFAHRKGCIDLDVVARPMGAFLICNAARAARLALGWPLISKGMFRTALAASIVEPPNSCAAAENCRSPQPDRPGSCRRCRPRVRAWAFDPVPSAPIAGGCSGWRSSSGYARRALHGRSFRSTCTSKKNPRQFPAGGSP